jgi:glycosyltransferase involved in cell wall biosynthesis
MRKVLLIIPSLEYSGAGKQLTLLARGLPRERVEPRVCVLGRDGPYGEELRQAGVPLDILGWQRRLDLTAAWRLRQLVRSWKPDVVHVWQSQTLRLLSFLVGRAILRRCVVSAPLAAAGGQEAWLDRWLLRQAARVVASGAAEAERCRQNGLAPDRIAQVPFGVELHKAEGKGAPDPLPVPITGSRFLLGVGPIAFHKGFQDAIWAFDILKFLYDDLQLLLVGEGPDRGRLEAFSRNIRIPGRIHFLGPRHDLNWLMAHCEAVWVPSHVDAGRNVALEAMAAGRPVVASRLPGLAEIVVDGQTGFLVPPGDKPALARQTRSLTDNAGLRDQMGAAGRQRVREHFAVERMVAGLVQLYDVTSS